MRALFQKEGQSIFSFKKGDIIIRLKPVVTKDVKFNENLGIEMQVAKNLDHSWREPHEFVGIYNNIIYLRDLKQNYEGKYWVSKANLEEWSEDWALFKIPDGLTLEDCL